MKLDPCQFPGCEKTYIRVTNGKYCSDECRDKAKKETNRIWRKNNKKRWSGFAKGWVINNRDKWNEYQRKRNSKDREAVNKYQREYNKRKKDEKEQ